METKPKILIVDDEEVFCKTLASGLKGRGYEVIYATDGATALNLVLKENPDLMTLDIRMPGESRMLAVNGLEVLVKAKQLRKDMPVIMVSATDLADEDASLKKMGAQAVHHKPIDLASLLETIKELLSGAPREKGP